MKTAIQFLTLATVLTFLAFLNTISYQEPSLNHPPPKSTRVIPPSSKSRENPFPTLQTSAKKLTDHELKVALKAEWSKLNSRPNNRELPILISHLRELGRRKALDGIEFLETLPTLDSPSDFLQAQTAVIAGWGISDYSSVATRLYKNGFTDLFSAPTKKTDDPFEQPGIPSVKRASELVEYEIQSRWITNDAEGFIAMLDEVDHNRSINPFRREKIHQRFPSLPREGKSEDDDPFPTITNDTGITSAGIKPRYETF